ncbi:hypothetical protein FEM48_Zijuj07G0015600 [Ziziphus jujuba var. spinosa]|uniref:Disease resistance RPP13-like protein 3 n=1 Tax=Ziziphus jujuba var. spinosa TaxID=714518 RepID=A0A978V1P1_ZIZJJ|nr:hypothetical protein FEM48_Zijuj07G0015600 [Ziziphus jujuba var. spinosa]
MRDDLIVFVLESLINVVKEEASLLGGVKDQVTSLQNHLQMINAFLQNSEKERDENDVVKEVFIDQLRDVTFEAEDVIYEYMVHVIMQKRRNVVKKSLHFRDLHDVADTITSIDNKIEQILKHKETYITRGALQADHDHDVKRYSLDRSKSKVERDDSVGFSHHANNLIDQLLDEKNQQRDVVSIIGMGGSGKSKLARKIYDIVGVDHGSFECCAWVYGCREFNYRDWLLGILNCLVSRSRKKETEDKSVDELKATLLDCLQGKRYFVVLDNMWKTGVWNIIKAAFPDDSNGSRILITCREKVVSMEDSRIPPYFLPFLDEVESWELLRNKVFQEEQCPSDLEIIGKQLAQSCKGLPLSIVVLADLLKHIELSHWTWSNYIGNVNSYLTEDKTRCLDVMAKSYKHLPKHLKSCFLYLGSLPDGFENPARQIMELWSAEGFIQANDTREVINVAEEYLTDLVNRSLVQVSSRRTDGGVKTFRIHEMLRELAKFESVREKFLEVHSTARPINSSMACKVRRLSIQGNTSQYFASDAYCNPSLSARSLLLFGERNVFETKQWQRVFKIFIYIRVLYLWEVHVNSIPKEIDNLISLRYIRIWSDGLLTIPSIPSSICNLGYLETIDISGDVKECLPKHIWRMKQLRHLRVSKHLRLPKPSRRTGRHENLSNLRILSGLVVDKKTKFLMAQHKFPNVKKLHLVYDIKMNMNEAEVAQVLESLNNLRQLKCLKLIGFAKFEPRPNLLPSTIEKITFISSYLDSEHLEILGALSNLRILKIRKTYGSNVPSLLIRCINGEFPNLEVFEMMGLRVETWELEKGAMPNLQRLVIKECYELRDLPNQVYSLTKLQVVEVSRMSGYFTRRLMGLNKNNVVFKLLIDSNP